MNRKKAVLKPIPVTEQDLEYLNGIILSSEISSYVKAQKVKKIVGGYCSTCGGIPTQQAHYHVHGATVIEKYCDSCIREKRFAG